MDYLNSKMDFFKKPKGKSILIIGLLLIAGLFFSLLNVLDLEPSRRAVKASLTLKPYSADSFGVEPDVTFELKSTEKLSKSKIRETIRFEPAVTFEVKAKNSLLGSIFSKVLAQDFVNGQDTGSTTEPAVSQTASGTASSGVEGPSESEENFIYEYEIIPDAELDEDKVYSISATGTDVLRSGVWLGFPGQGRFSGAGKFSRGKFD